MSDQPTPATKAPCHHGFCPPVVCPQCHPEEYERARPQVERWLRQQTEAGRIVRSL